MQKYIFSLISLFLLASCSLVPKVEQRFYSGTQILQSNFSDLSINSSNSLETLYRNVYTEEFMKKNVIIDKNLTKINIIPTADNTTYYENKYVFKYVSPPGEFEKYTYDIFRKYCNHLGNEFVYKKDQYDLDIKNNRAFCLGKGGFSLETIQDGILATSNGVNYPIYTVIINQSYVNESYGSYQEEILNKLSDLKQKAIKLVTSYEIDGVRKAVNYIVPKSVFNITIENLTNEPKIIPANSITYLRTDIATYSVIYPISNNSFVIDKIGDCSIIENGNKILINPKLKCQYNIKADITGINFLAVKYLVDLSSSFPMKVVTAYEEYLGEF